MMHLFVTSSLGASVRNEDDVRIPCAIDGSNHFLELLRQYWPETPKCLVISSDPDSEEMNDLYNNIYAEAFRLTGLPLTQIDVCDKRNEDRIVGMLNNSNVVILAGGHVPTQNSFFKRIHLKELLKSYGGIVIGISAGSMNCADTVYAQPEIEGEATNPQYQRYLDGLGLTDISILPHFQDVRELTVDGLRVLEDISLPDSNIRPFCALNDGSFIFVENGKAILYGEAYLISGGNFVKICETDNIVELK